MVAQVPDAIGGMVIIGFYHSPMPACKTFFAIIFACSQSSMVFVSFCARVWCIGILLGKLFSLLMVALLLALLRFWRGSGLMGSCALNRFSGDRGGTVGPVLPGTA